MCLCMGERDGIPIFEQGKGTPLSAHKNLVDNFTTLFFVEIKFNCHKCEI